MSGPGRRGGGSYMGPVRITPVRVILLIALVGSLGYVAFAITVRDASQIPMLSSGALALGIVFGALAFAGAYATYRAGLEHANARALVLAILGGIAAMLSAGSIAAAVVLALVLQA